MFAHPSPPTAWLRGLYVITDERLGGGHLAIAAAALEGGARIIQLRDKSTPIARLLPLARELRRFTRQYEALLLINDRIDLALWCQADGVHLGPEDWPVAAARELLGPQRLIGASCGSPEEARQAEEQGASYLGVGAVFSTQTKTDAGQAIGLEGLKRIQAATTLPLAAIGGISEANIASVAATGVEMICVVSAVAAAGSARAMAVATAALITKKSAA